MTAIVTGDYSKYPASIRDLFPRLAGETCGLRQAWEVYERLFMERKTLTDALVENLGGVLGMFQSMLQGELFLSIARLTDRDSHIQPNLSLWSLLAAIPDSPDAGFGPNVTRELDELCVAAASVRKHRHKRIAHLDLNASTNNAVLPVVTFREIFSVLQKIEAFLNLFYWEFERTTMFFDALPAYDLTGPAENTVFKARAYDQLEAENLVPKGEWRTRAEAQLFRDPAGGGPAQPQA